MNWIGEIWRRILMLVRRGEFARELEEEMRLHRELKEKELIAEGVEAREARYAANRQFGNAMNLRERDARTGAKAPRNLGLGDKEIGGFRTALLRAGVCTGHLNMRGGHAYDAHQETLERWVLRTSAFDLMRARVKEVSGLPASGEALSLGGNSLRGKGKEIPQKA